MLIKLFVFKCLHCMCVFAQNFLIHDPSTGGIGRKMENNFVFKILKPLDTLNGNPNRGLEVHLVVPNSSFIRTPEADKPQQEHSIALKSTQQSTNNRVAYREDLDTALEELEKRQLVKKYPQSSNGVYDSTSLSVFPFQVATVKPFYEMKKPNNLREIVELLKKGIEIYSNKAKPSTDDVEWIRIKVPNIKQ